MRFGLIYMQIRPNVPLQMSNNYTEYNEYDFFSSPEVLNSTDTAKSYLSDQCRIDWEKYSSIEFGWDHENGSEYSFFNSEIKDDDRRSTKSRSPSDFRDHSLEKDQRHLSREKSPSKNSSMLKTNTKVNGKRKADDTLDLGYKEPKPKKKSTKNNEGWDSLDYSNNHAANDKVDEILGLLSGKPPTSFLSSEEPSLDSQEAQEYLPDSFIGKPDANQESFLQNASKDTTDNSMEGSFEKCKIKNYISTTSNGFAVVLSKHGKDPQDEIHQILKNSIVKNLAAPNNEMFTWHLENILLYAKDKIEGKTTKTTAKGNTWRQNKVSNKSEIYSVFHPQESDDNYTLSIKKILRETIENYFQSNSFLRWVDECYKTDKAGCKNFFKSKENIQEITRVYLSQQKWRSRFI